MKQLNDNLLAVRVPMDCVYFMINSRNNICGSPKWFKWQLLSDNPLEGDFEILGYCTKNESTVIGYELEEIKSLLASKECYLVNPFGDKPAINWETENKANASILNWQAAQVNVHDKFLILNKK